GWKPWPRAPERRVTTQVTTQTSRLRAPDPSKLLGNLVDLVGIEPTTSSMPWKRAPSCATGPLARMRQNCRKILRADNSRLPERVSQTTGRGLASLSGPHILRKPGKLVFCR